MTDPAPFSCITDLGTSLRGGEFTCAELTDLYLDRIERFNPRLNAFLRVYTESARSEARRADEELAGGRDRGPLHGIPIAIKDIIDVEGDVTTAGGILLPDTPAAADAEVIRRLREAGAVILGKLNLHEYAWGGTTDNAHYGRAYNPWKEGHTPGGSSGGSGAAVAAGLCAAALGTDTLGSIRIPASYCGCVGFKPTFGLVSKRGAFPLSWPLDTIGPLARSVADAALVMRALAGPDAGDPYSAMREPDDWGLGAAPDVAGLRLGVIRGFSLAHDGTQDERAVRAAVEAAIAKLGELGAARVDLADPGMEELIAATYAVAHSDAAAIHRERYERDADKIGANVRARLKVGLDLTPTRVAEAHDALVRFRHRFGAVMRDADALVFPTTTVAAHAFDPERTPTTGRYTAAINGLGWPAISLPCGFTPAGLPIGLQLAAPMFAERTLVNLARAWEAATESSAAAPPGF